MWPAWQIDEEKEERKKERARLLLAGHSFTDEDDPFEGSTPEVSTHLWASRILALHTRSCCICDLSASLATLDTRLCDHPLDSFCVHLNLQEIQQYVQKETAGASNNDPFEVQLDPGFL